MNKESEKMLVVISLGTKGRVPKLGSHWESNPEPPTSATSGLTTELRQPRQPAALQFFTFLFQPHSSVISM